MTNKVQFATIQLQMSEEYHAEIQTTLPSAATRLWNAAIGGYHAAAESVMSPRISTKLTKKRTFVSDSTRFKPRWAL